jgi:phosphohistidine phosphatase
MDLFLLRHGIAVERGDPRFPCDADRPLVPRGRKKVQRVAEFLRRLELSFDRVLTSPWVRARQTADIICQELALKGKLHESELLIPGQPSLDVAQLVRLAGREPRVILLVGHEPGLSTLAANLLTGGEGLEIRMKKAGLCRITLDESAKGQKAVLEWLLAPETLT